MRFGFDSFNRHVDLTEGEKRALKEREISDDDGYDVDWQQ